MRTALDGLHIFLNRIYANNNDNNNVIYAFRWLNDNMLMMPMNTKSTLRERRITRIHTMDDLTTWVVCSWRCTIHRDIENYIINLSVNKCCYENVVIIKEMKREVLRRQSVVLCFDLLLLYSFPFHSNKLLLKRTAAYLAVLPHRSTIYEQQPTWRTLITAPMNECVYYYYLSTI